MHQQSLFDQQQLTRVSGRIGAAILAFHKQRMQTAPAFHAEELREHVQQQTQLAPASADRVLRELRKQGLLNYRVLNRAQSLYEFVR